MARGQNGSSMANRFWGWIRRHPIISGIFGGFWLLIILLAVFAPKEETSKVAAAPVTPIVSATPTASATPTVSPSPTAVPTAAPAASPSVAEAPATHQAAPVTRQAVVQATGAARPLRQPPRARRRHRPSRRPRRRCTTRTAPLPGLPVPLRSRKASLATAPHSTGITMVSPAIPPEFGGRTAPRG